VTVKNGLGLITGFEGKEENAKEEKIFFMGGRAHPTG